MDQTCARSYLQNMYPKHLARDLCKGLFGENLSVKDWTSSFDKVSDNLDILRALLAGFIKTSAEDIENFKRVFPLPEYPGKVFSVYNCSRGSTKSFEVKKHAWERFCIRFLGTHHPVQGKREGESWQQYLKDSFLTIFAATKITAVEENKKKTEKKRGGGQSIDDRERWINTRHRMEFVVEGNNIITVLIV